MTPLHLAAIGNHQLACSDLLEAGADVNAQDPTGKTPLMHACLNGFKEVVTLLLEYDADADMTDKEGIKHLEKKCVYRI